MRNLVIARQRDHSRVRPARGACGERAQGTEAGHGSRPGSRAVISGRMNCTFTCVRQSGACSDCCAVPCRLPDSHGHDRRPGLLAPGHPWNRATAPAARLPCRNGTLEIPLTAPSSAGKNRLNESIIDNPERYRPAMTLHPLHHGIWIVEQEFPPGEIGNFRLLRENPAAGTIRPVHAEELCGIRALYSRAPVSAIRRPSGSCGIEQGKRSCRRSAATPIDLPGLLGMLAATLMVHGAFAVPAERQSRERDAG